MIETTQGQAANAAKPVQANETVGIKPKPHLTRRKFLEQAGKIGLGIGAEVILASCGAPPAPTPTRGPTAAPKPTLDIIPTVSPNDRLMPAGSRLPDFRGSYSSLIEQYNLVPRVYSEAEGRLERGQAAVDLVRNVERALSAETNINLPTLRQLGLRPELFPVNIPENWTPRELLQQFAGELSDPNRFRLQEGNAAGAVMDMGQTEFEFDQASKQWRRTRGVISFDPIMVDRALRFYQSPNEFYYDRGIADIASAVVHEYIHMLQADRMCQIVNERLAAGQITTEQAETYVRGYWGQLDEQRNGESYAFWQQYVINNLPQDTPDRARIVELYQNNRVSMSEVQALTMNYAFIYVMNRLNNSDHFPSSQRFDPETGNAEASRRNREIQDAFARQLGPDFHYYPDNYATYLNHVAAGGFTGANLDWIRRAQSIPPSPGGAPTPTPAPPTLNS